MTLPCSKAAVCCRLSATVHFLTRQSADRAGQIFDALLVLARWLGQTNPSNGG
jgi:hypothetical protein